MEPTALSPIQTEILKAIESQSNKSKYSETILAKKIRENVKLDTKKKAIIALTDLEKVLSYLEETSDTRYSLTLNSANDLLLERASESKPLTPEAHQRRLRSERSMTIFTNKDVR